MFAINLTLDMLASFGRDSYIFAHQMAARTPLSLAPNPTSRSSGQHNRTLGPLRKTGDLTLADSPFGLAPRDELNSEFEASEDR